MIEPNKEALRLIRLNGYDGAIRHCKQVLAMAPDTYGMRNRILRYELLLDILLTKHGDVPQQYDSYQHGNS
jgi:hypothetical protein